LAHGIPDSRPLENGDIVKIDVTVFKDGFHGDCSATITVGDVDSMSLKLVNSTRKALQKGIEVCRPGKCFSQIGEEIEKAATLDGFFIVPEVMGHGVGRSFHCFPFISHISILIVELLTIVMISSTNKRMHTRVL